MFEKQKYIFAVSLVAMTIAVISACTKNYDKESPFSNVVYLDVASKAEVNNFTFKNTLEDATKTVSAMLAFPSDKEVKAKIAVDPAKAAVFNGRYGTSYPVLDSKYWKVSGGDVSIPAGSIVSKPVSLDLHGLKGLEIDKNYILPLSITSAQGIDLLGASSTVYYVITRSSAITTAVSLKDNYFEVPGFDAGSPTAAIMNNIKFLTYEAIIKVDKFQPTISSVMGIEQYCLLRIGDAGFPNSQLQFCSPGDRKFPKADRTKVLQDNTWYHIAVVYNTEEKTAVMYVDGKELCRVDDYGSGEPVNLGKQRRGKDFMFKIGHSYGEPEDYTRQLDGEICEVRVWNVLRSQEEIFASMYDVDPKTPGLLAYWKFNEGSGDVVKDWTGNGNDAVAHKPAVWPDGILVPKKNQ